MANMTARPAVEVRTFLADRGLTRVGRANGVEAVVANTSGSPLSLDATLEVPKGVRILGAARQSLRLKVGEEKDVRWQVQADQATCAEIKVKVGSAGTPMAERVVPVRFLPAVRASRGYIPAPKPVKTKVLVGAHNCPLWEADQPGMWSQILKHTERVPALGFYAQESPEVADWETKWAAEHGVDFFIYCWYRSKQGGPVEQRFGSAIHDAFFKSRYQKNMRFTIMWENQSRGTAGVADEADLMTNLLPFWIDNYFKHPSYLKVDNKPVLFIYRPEFLIGDLGGEANVVAAFDKMRQACRDAGFAGLTILGEYRGLDAKHLALMKRIGLDYTFAYCWHVMNNPTPQQAIDTQMSYIRKTQELGVLPQVVTVSQAWSGWHDEGSIWKIPPKEFEGLLRQAKEFIGTIPPEQLGSRMLILDNWNEWGEGHYIAPYTEYGFGYLDAVRNVFAPEAGAHTDLIPEDVGLGPYDKAYRGNMVLERRQRALLAKSATKPGAPEGLVGWWAFDEKDDSPVALDYSGHCLGAMLKNAKRAPGIDGRALVCDGGSAVVPGSALLSVTDAMTIECWVKTDVAGQSDKWFVNRIYSGGMDTGFRLGLGGGRPSFAIPVTSFSHHLAADVALPVGRWVHLAGTFDGKVMRLYMDGELHGNLERPGAAKGSNLPLTLGNYDAGHQAHFTGLLDEVRLYNRCLPTEEVAAHARAFAR